LVLFSSADWILAIMARIAIPIFKARVSPVFDTCTRILLIDFENNRQIAQKELDIDNFSLRERLQILEKNDVAVIICGGISDVFHAILSNLNILLISGICGNVDEVIKAHCDGRLDDPCFFMPGYKACDENRSYKNTTTRFAGFKSGHIVPI
jgi:predicted Fe-Mo cluster-binding NifX family protein